MKSEMKWISPILIGSSVSIGLGLVTYFYPQSSDVTNSLILCFCGLTFTLIYETSDQFSKLKKEFENWIRPILEDGKVSNELAPRPYLDQQYPHLFWAHFIFILRFWAKDDSPGFEATDSAIEKSVNLAFELLGKGALDQALDFAKFMFQQPMN